MHCFGSFLQQGGTCTVFVVFYSKVEHALFLRFSTARWNMHCFCSFLQQGGTCTVFVVFYSKVEHALFL